MIDEVNISAIDLSKSYSFLVISGFIGQNLIEKLSLIAYRNHVLFLTDYEDKNSVEEVLETIKELNKTKFAGLKDLSKTVIFANYPLLRHKYKQETQALYGSATAAVAGKLYAIENIAQPVMGAKFGALKGFLGVRFKISQDQVNAFDRENLNPLVESFGSIMAYNCKTQFKGENVELQQYPVIRTLDYIDRVLKHFLNQYVFASFQLKDIRLHIHRTIFNMLNRLKELKILRDGRITHFAINKDQPDRFDIKLEITPMFGVKAFEYSIGIDQYGDTESIVD